MVYCYLKKVNTEDRVGVSYIASYVAWYTATLREAPSTPPRYKSAFGGTEQQIY